MKIGIQGTYGSFHHKAATKRFGTSQTFIERVHFSESAIKPENKQIDKAVMTIENSIAGAALLNYSLINECYLYITGEYYPDVNHYLSALPGQTLGIFFFCGYINNEQEKFQKTIYRIAERVIELKIPEEYKAFKNK